MVAKQRISIPNNILLGEVSSLLANGQEVIIMTKGNSMLPFLRSERDSVALRFMEPAVGKIALAEIRPGQYVLHRITAIDGDRVTLMGDGNLRGVEHCLKGDVKGCVVRIIDPRGKERTPGDGRLWRMLIPVRRYILFIYRKLHGIKNIQQ